MWELTVFSNVHLELLFSTKDIIKGRRRFTISCLADLASLFGRGEVCSGSVFVL